VPHPLRLSFSQRVGPFFSLLSWLATTSGHGFQPSRTLPASRLQPLREFDFGFDAVRTLHPDLGFSFSISVLSATYDRAPARERRSVSSLNQPRCTSVGSEARCRSAIKNHADCDRSSIRLLTSVNSLTNALLFLPASVAASISVLNKIAVAKSALHSKQHFSVLPGSSNNSSVCPQTLQVAIKSCSVPLGPLNMTFLSHRFPHLRNAHFTS
jgi:hypothetical protein